MLDSVRDRILEKRLRLVIGACEEEVGKKDEKGKKSALSDKGSSIILGEEHIH